MQLRISHGPYSALGISEYATTEDIRAAFLSLTKQFHPARFGRMSTDLQRLSNEVFLGIKSAHDQLQRALGGTHTRPGLGSASSSQAIPVMTDGAGTGRTPAPHLLRRTGQVPIDQARTTGQGRAQLGTQPPVNTTQTQQLARGTDRAGVPQRPSTPVIQPQGTRPATPPMNTPAHGMQRPMTPPMNTPAQGMQRPPTPAQGMRPPTPGQRPVTPVAARPTTPVRPTTPAATRPSTAPMMPPKPSADLNPGTVRGVQPAPAFDERSALREAMMMLNEKRWGDARQALHNLAAKIPQSKSYRALLCLARGREAHAAGRPDEATLEYQRALQLDPNLDLANQALAELGRRR
ncbi:MAG TPA: hypothetical protein VMZ53_10835 [Kofleriaceae bacterium]|nr:hypothetical protein [Kofleriaceae bacterium]